MLLYEMHAAEIQRPFPGWRRWRGRPANTWLIRTTEEDLRPLNYELHTAFWHTTGDMVRNCLRTATLWRVRQWRNKTKKKWRRGVHFNRFAGIAVVFLQELVKQRCILLQILFGQFELLLLRLSDVLQLPHLVALHAQRILQQTRATMMSYVRRTGRDVY